MDISADQQLHQFCLNIAVVLLDVGPTYRMYPASPETHPAAAGPLLSPEPSAAAILFRPRWSQEKYGK